MNSSPYLYSRLIKAEAQAKCFRYLELFYILPISLLIHPSIHFLPLIPLGFAGAYLTIFGRRRGSPSTSHKFMAGLTYRDKQPPTLAFTPMGNLKWPINQLSPSLHVLPVSAWVFSGYSGFLPHPENMQSGGRLIGHSKLPIGVNVSVGGCLSLYVSPVMTWRLVPSCDP